MKFGSEKIDYVICENHFIEKRFSREYKLYFKPFLCKKGKKHQLELDGTRIGDADEQLCASCAH